MSLDARRFKLSRDLLAFWCSDHRRQRNSSGNSYGDGYPDREDRFFNEPHNRKENAASGQSGPVFRASGIGDHGNLQRGLSDQPISQGTGS